MQKEDKAEYEAEKVRDLFTSIFKTKERSENLLEHIRFRTGLLLERRAGIFAFAHLTFQEYLAAQAVYEGNSIGIKVDKLVEEHDSGRWDEVIPLYCGIAPVPEKQKLIDSIINQDDTNSLSFILTETFLAAGTVLAENKEFRQNVLNRIALAPDNNQLNRFPPEEIALVANRSIGKIKSTIRTSEAFRWFLRHHPELCNFELIANGLKNWKKLTSNQICELFYLLHRFGPDNLLYEISQVTQLYSSKGPHFQNNENYETQAAFAAIGIYGRKLENDSISTGTYTALYQILNAFESSKNYQIFIMNTYFEYYIILEFLAWCSQLNTPADISILKKIILSATKFIKRLENIIKGVRVSNEHIASIHKFEDWINSLKIELSKRSS